MRSNKEQRLHRLRLQEEERRVAPDQHQGRIAPICATGSGGGGGGGGGSGGGGGGGAGFKLDDNYNSRIVYKDLNVSLVVYMYLPLLPHLRPLRRPRGPAVRNPMGYGFAHGGARGGVFSSSPAKLACLGFSVVLMGANVAFVLFISIAVCLVWKLLLVMAILLMWVMGACCWPIELAVMTPVAAILYPTYTLPDALQWIPWLMLGLSSCLVFAARAECERQERDGRHSPVRHLARSFVLMPIFFRIVICMYRFCLVMIVGSWLSLARSAWRGQACSRRREWL